MIEQNSNVSSYWTPTKIADALRCIKFFNLRYLQRVRAIKTPELVRGDIFHRFARKDSFYKSDGKTPKYRDSKSFGNAVRGFFFGSNSWWII